jgi:DNA-directed RNA polymerase specialized sigma24 family protein
MTDSQLVIGILNNDERVWRHICRNMKAGFMAKVFSMNWHGKLASQDLEDIFQESCIVLMQTVKGGGFEVKSDNGIFNFLITTGDKKAKNLIKKKSPLLCDELPDGPEVRTNKKDSHLTDADKQKLQHEFLEMIYDTMPHDCKRIFKLFYWDHKPMDDIASIMGMKNADSIITKKSRCMSKFKEIGRMLVKNDEFSEDDIRDTVERVALRALLEEEMANFEDGYQMAAYNPDEDKE